MRKASQWLLLSCQIQTPVSLQDSVHRERTCSISSDSIYLDYTASKHYLCPRYFIKWYWCVWWSIFERLHFWSDKLQQASLVKFTFSMYTWSVFERAPIIPICRNLYYSKQTHNGTGVLAFIEIKTTEKKTGKLILSSFFLWPNEKKVRVQIRANPHSSLLSLLPWQNPMCFYEFLQEYSCFKFCQTKTPNTASFTSSGSFLIHFSALFCLHQA